MSFEIKKPHELRKMEKEEEDAKVKAKKQAIIDFAETVLIKAGINQLLQENRNTLLREGEKIEKVIFIDLDDLRTRGIAFEEVCGQIKEIMSDNEYIAEVVDSDSRIKLIISVDPKFFREEENEECK